MHCTSVTVGMYSQNKDHARVNVKDVKCLWLTLCALVEFLTVYMCVYIWITSNVAHHFSSIIVWQTKNLKFSPFQPQN